MSHLFFQQRAQQLQPPPQQPYIVEQQPQQLYTMEQLVTFRVNMGLEQLNRRLDEELTATKKRLATQVKALDKKITLACETLEQVCKEITRANERYVEERESKRIKTNGEKDDRTDDVSDPATHPPPPL